MKRVALLLVLSFGLSFLNASEETYPKAMVSFEDHLAVTKQAYEHRKDRLVSLNEFLELSKGEDVLILDTRSKLRYDRIHLKGAKHLNFSDFSQDSLRRLIPSSTTKILIYCNNNFEGNQVDFVSKIAPPMMLDTTKKEQRPVTMALNVPTFINLYGYGYENVYELDELVDVTDPRLQFGGSLLQQGPGKHRIFLGNPFTQ